MKDCVWKNRFYILFIAAKLALLLPYSNESEKSLLRTVCKKKTTFPASMGSKTLNSILTVKYTNLNLAKKCNLGIQSRSSISSSTVAKNLTQNLSYNT